MSDKYPLQHRKMIEELRSDLKILYDQLITERESVRRRIQQLETEMVKAQAESEEIDSLFDRVLGSHVALTGFELSDTAVSHEP